MVDGIGGVQVGQGLGPVGEENVVAGELDVQLEASTKAWSLAAATMSTSE